MKNYFSCFSCEISPWSLQAWTQWPLWKNTTPEHTRIAFTQMWGLLFVQNSIQGVVKPSMTPPSVPTTSKSILGALPGQDMQHLPQQMLRTGFKPRLRPGKHPSLCSLRCTESKAMFSTVVLLHLPAAHPSPLPPSSYQRWEFSVLHQNKGFH